MKITNELGPKGPLTFISYNSFLIWQEIERTCFCYLNQDNNETNDLHCRKLIIGATWNDEMSV